MPEPQLSALPSPRARALAFVAIILGGLMGAMIGMLFIDLQCEGDCALAKGLAFLAGAVVAAAGTAVVAVLALRAMGEWRRLREEELRGDSP